jgi:phosphoribosylformylglycinamidine cyclo-ligase
VQAGDVVLALGSSGLHSNGYSLVRRVIAHAGWGLTRQVPEFGRTLGEELLTPTRVYAADLLALVRTPGMQVHALSHVTGGGLAAHLARVLPPGLLATVDRGTWAPPPVFQVVARLGRVPREDLERTLNLGVGFVCVLPEASAEPALQVCRARGIPAWVLGHVRRDAQADRGRAPRSEAEVTRGAKGVDGGAVRLVGEHPR